jgi:glucose/arabinose dehydrogenase
MDGDGVAGDWQIFADGFGGPEPGPRSALYRPTGIAQGPDGSLYFSDSRRGRIWKVTYQGG